MSKLIANKPKGLLRWALRAPRWLYHIGLGWVLGERFLMLSYVGRRSGLRRETVIEVIGHDKEKDIYFVASGWGTRSDWYRSILANPAVSIQVGKRRFDARAQTLDLEESVQRLSAYASKHPAAFHELSRLMTGNALKGTEQECRQMAQSVPVIGFYQDGKPLPN